MINDINAPVGILYLELMIHHAQSLKEKRMVLNRIKSRINNTFKVSIAEIDGQEKWQYCCLGICVIGCDQKVLDSRLNKIVNFMEGFSDIELMDHKTEFC